MKQLKESILDADFDIDAGYIEYDWFQWPCVYKNSDFISHAQDCNKGMYARLACDDINKVIDSIENQVKENLEKHIFREVKDDRFKLALANLMLANNTINKHVEYWNDSMINTCRKIYKFIDELFSVPLAKKLLSKFDITDVYLSLGSHYASHNWYAYIIFHKDCVKVKDRQVLVDEWTKIFKKHGIDDIGISNADGRIFIDQFSEDDKLQFDSSKAKKLAQASAEADFEIRIVFDPNKL